MGTIEDQVAYLKNIDSESIDEDLEDIGVTPANMEAVIEGLEMMQRSTSAFTALLESYKQPYLDQLDKMDMLVGARLEKIQPDPRFEVQIEMLAAERDLVNIQGRIIRELKHGSLIALVK